jgi:hypothetical protein
MGKDRSMMAMLSEAEGIRRIDPTHFTSPDCSQRNRAQRATRTRTHTHDPIELNLRRTDWHPGSLIQATSHGIQAQLPPYQGLPVDGTKTFTIIIINCDPRPLAQAWPAYHNPLPTMKVSLLPLAYSSLQVAIVQGD